MARCLLDTFPFLAYRHLPTGVTLPMLQLPKPESCPEYTSDAVSTSPWGHAQTLIFARFHSAVGLRSSVLPVRSRLAQQLLTIPLIRSVLILAIPIPRKASLRFSHRTSSVHGVRKGGRQTTHALSFSQWAELSDQSQLVCYSSV